MNALPYSLDDLYWFVLIAESGGLSSASRRYDIAKSTLSKRLSRLEEALGVKLLQRNTNSTTLTDAGGVFLNEISPILHRLEEVSGEFAKLESEPRGIIKMTASGTFGKFVVLPLVNKFLHAYPQVNIDIDVTDKYVDVIAQGVDIAIRIGELTDSALYARKVASVRKVLCVSPDYAEHYGIPQSLEDLKQHSFIVQSKSSSTIRLINSEQSKVFSTKGRLTITPSDNLLAAVSAGLGIAPLPEIQIAKLLHEGEIIHVLPEWHLPSQDVYLLSPSNRYRSLAVRLLLDYFLEAIPRRIDELLVRKSAD